METITTPADMSEGLSLYAVWVKSQGNLQSWTGCGSLQIGEVTALTDTRDHDTYAVAKLADGKCWMIENLRLNNTNPDNATGALAQGYSSSFKGLANAESLWEDNSTVANSLYSTDGSEGTVAITGSYRAQRFPRYSNSNTNDAVVNMTTPNGANIYSYGNYYTWPAITADTSYYAAINQSRTATSICPSGWRLPQGGDKTRIESDDDNDYWNLIVDGLYDGIKPTDYDSSTTPNYASDPEGLNVSRLLRTFPNNFLYSGNISRSSVGGKSTVGYYWSSTVASDFLPYYLSLSARSVKPGTVFFSSCRGLPARCVTGN